MYIQVKSCHVRSCSVAELTALINVLHYIMIRKYVMQIKSLRPSVVSRVYALTNVIYMYIKQMSKCFQHMKNILCFCFSYENSPYMYFFFFCTYHIHVYRKCVVWQCKNTNKYIRKQIGVQNHPIKRKQT
jgi:hypothetical protein